jgi:enediyne biosynthesis protein E4
VALLAGVAANEDGAEQANMGLAIGDYLHTGCVSLAIAHFDVEYTALYTYEGGMNFTDNSVASGIARGTRGYVGWGDAFVDFANRGWPVFPR